MTKLDSWIIELATEIAKDDSESARQVPTTLVQRIGISLLSARARECRHQAGQLEVSGLIQHPPLLAMRNQLRERSSDLEKLAMEAATVWPPDHTDPEQSLIERPSNVRSN